MLPKLFLTIRIFNLGAIPTSDVILSLVNYLWLGNLVGQGR